LISSRDKGISFPPFFQACSGIRAAFHPISNEGSFHGLRMGEREAANSPPSTNVVTNAWSYISTHSSSCSDV
jgi:hypothetical protein